MFFLAFLGAVVSVCDIWALIDFGMCPECTPYTDSNFNSTLQKTT